MKKILLSTLLILSFAGSAFAAPLATATPTPSAGVKIYGGADAAAALIAPSPLVQLSTGVFGMVNYVAAANLSTGYLIATRHLNGSKNFATTNDITNIYWKQAAKAADATAAKTAMASEVTAVVSATTVFAAGQGWTSY